MGKKKRHHPDVDEILQRPWCYYCERDFDDLKILINHQKAKHFKCDRCGRRLNTAGGLNVHMTQVHKESLTQVENAIPSRAGLEYEIFGMEGVPEDVVQSHNQRVVQQYYESQAEHHAATGNPPPGSSNAGPNAPKKPKLESKGDLKARLAAHKAKKAAEAGASSGDVTPIAGAHGGHSPAPAQSPATFQQAGSPTYPQQQMPYSAQQGSPGQPAYAQPYPQPGFPPQNAQYPQQPPSGFPQQPGYGTPTFPTPGASPFPGQQFPQAPGQPYQAPFQAGPPRAQGSGSPPANFPYGAYQPPNRTPPTNPPQPARQGSLPGAPGLPQRPSFGAPHVNQFQLQQMHQGHVPPASGARPPGQNGQPAQGASSSIPGLEASVDELISSAGRQAESATPAANETEKKEPETGKKKKEKMPTKLMYSDNDISPEEKMARLPRYAFNPEARKEGETVVGTLEPPVTGVVVGQDDVVDSTG
ncbi:C2H2 finger domain-containing protein [Phyllosticta capitalensis]